MVLGILPNIILVVKTTEDYHWGHALPCICPLVLQEGTPESQLGLESAVLISGWHISIYNKVQILRKIHSK